MTFGDVCKVQPSAVLWNDRFDRCKFRIGQLSDYPGEVVIVISDPHESEFFKPCVRVISSLGIGWMILGCLRKIE